MPEYDRSMVKDLHSCSKQSKKLIEKADKTECQHRVLYLLPHNFLSTALYGYTLKVVFFSKITFYTSQIPQKCGY